jgi:hypothetical protein
MKAWWGVVVFQAYAAYRQLRNKGNLPIIESVKVGEKI